MTFIRRFLRRFRWSAVDESPDLKKRKILSLVAAVALTAAFALPGSAPSFVGRHLSAARSHQAANRLDEARAEYLKVLERDAGNLPAMSGLIEVSALRGDRDEEIYTLHRFVEKASQIGRLPSDLKKKLGGYKRTLAGRDKRTGKVGSYRAAYLRRLLSLGVAHLKKGRFHQALAIFNEVVHLDPDSDHAREAFDRIRTEGGNELADATVSGERELFADVTREWVEKQNALHNTWESAWKKKTENHTVMTDAGYDVLEITALSLEQLNQFFRKFYRYKENGGGTAHIQIRIYKDRDEYTLLGKPSVPWSGGYYNGSAIVTYDPRGSQNAADGRSSQEPSRSLNGLIQTLAHELSHHFTNIAPGTGVPAWLNEGMASFMEGTQLRSNGQVEWNLVAPHRLMPLVEYLDSPSPPDLARIIACDVEDYRIFYPYGWGIVYFLYNFEDDEGNYAYRDILHRYRSTYAGGVDHLQRFLEEIIEKPKREGIETLEDFEILLSGFIHQVKTEYLGKAEVARQYEARSDALMEKEDFEKAKLFLEKAKKKLEEDPNILWKLARVLEELGEKDRAAGTYRLFLNASEFHGIGDDPRLEEARSRIEELDPLAGRFTKVREQFEEDVLSVARGYRDDKLYLMALCTARELAVADNPSLAARDFYLDVEEESGRTLEQWQIVFNETDLVGWTGEDITGQFRVEGEKLVGVVTDGQFVTA